ncbi:Flagellar biosynthesis protein FlhA [Enhygromyxa salina]|uniref:Flagellar biosynthesis protein FlhA n=1 Tax=Enhygromyxa salina TaxID=215803 RepID=A0A0C2DDZ3_9BACT|nr:FHIPEP family type III secretion protein [Enhygromyxa salina]KIG17867.1 Flagellar biosynthesis protein FlhA [Enhygromyxa salina]
MSGPRSSGFVAFAAATRSLARELPGLAPAAVVIALLLCLLVPLPTGIVDLLLSLSLAAAVVLLVAGLRVRRAAEFLAFPSLVLLLTLYRLALNVSTTRLILSQADAGQVIDAFAGLVVRGDLLVGAVMFAVITAIQYFVIARGAERVAEVAARFALDGMPGQQAAIDADLRAGTISPREAQVRRAALSERSEFFARMDGVMRWVKGDAVVGLLITAINLVGGIAVGGVRAGRGVGESLSLYGTLAIGDGLLAQLPALLIALAAALLVARVDRVGGHARAAWLEPAMLLVPALLLGLLAAIPGMPALAFVTTAVGLVAVALWISARGLDRKQPVGEPEIRVHASFDEAARASISHDLAELRSRCEAALAISVPRLVLSPAGPQSALGPEQLELRLGERVLGRGRQAELPSASHSASGRDDALVLGCFQVLMDSAPRLVTLQAIEAELEAARRRHPALIRQAMRVVEPVDVLVIVRAFVRERIPMPSIDALLQALAEERVFHDPAERRQWPEHAREALADHWVRDLCDGAAQLGEPRWLRPTVDLEDAILARAHHGTRGLSLSLTDAERGRVVARICAGTSDRPVLLLCSSHARPAFACLLAGARPHVPVLSIGELALAGLATPASARVDVD